MRFLIVTGAALTLAFAVQAFAQAPLIGEEGMARPGGTYANIVAADAAACARLCAEDSICMAWTWRAPARGCELKAVAPPPAPETSAVSGLSQRAPAFLRQIAVKAPEPAPQIASGPLPTRPPLPAMRRTEPAAAAAADDDLDAALLGGPNGDAIRPRLGDRP